MRVTEDGQRRSITTNQAGKRAMFYTSEPTHPTVLDLLDLGPNSCPHYLRLTADEKRLMISDYSLKRLHSGRSPVPCGSPVAPQAGYRVPYRPGAAARSGVQVGPACGRGVPNAAR
jgi:hypothetical protein